jgi:hypothetical protein
VCRPGGRIGLANWTPDGFIGSLFKVVGAHVPPPAGVASPLRWGTEDHLRELFGEAADVAVERRQFCFRYRSPQAFFDTFRDYYGPVHRAWGALDADGRASLEAGIVALATEANRGADGAMVAPSDYLEVVVSKRAG